MDGIGRQIILLEPNARPPMELRHPIGLRLPQVRLQHLGEEMVIAIPLALVVERNDEEVAAFQSFQHRFAIFLVGDGIAQRTAQAIENGGLQQEVADVVRAGAARPLPPDSPARNDGCR